jgi:hypothetical protein
MPRRIYVLPACVVMSSGCALAMPVPTRPDARFEREYLRPLRHGMSPEAVRALLGDPTSTRTSSARRETWRYERFGSTGLEHATLTKRLDRDATRVDLLNPVSR